MFGFISSLLEPVARHRAVFVSAAIVFAVTAWSCRWNVGTVEVYLVYNAVPEKNPLRNVDKLKVRIEGPDMMPMERDLPLASAKGGGLDDVPLGRDRVLIVEGLDRSGRVLSRGISRPFYVGEGKTKVFLFMSNKGSFSPPPSASGDDWKKLYTTSMRSANGIKGRAFLATAELKDGLLVAVGGADPEVKDLFSPLSASDVSPAADLFDPTSSAFLVVEGAGDCESDSEPLCLARPRAFHTVTFLQDLDSVIVVGGEPIGEPASEVMSPEDLAFGIGPEPNVPRTRHVSVLAGDPAALFIAGGKDQVGRILDSTEVLRHEESDFTGGPPLGAGRFASAAAALHDRILVTGGFEDSDGNVPSRKVDAISWDADAVFHVESVENCLVEPRAWHTAVTVEDRNSKQWVFVCGGLTDGNTVSNTCELLDPETLRSSMAPDNVKLFNPRWAHSATVLPNQKVLVAGGFSNVQGTSVLQNAVLLDPVGGEYNLGIIPMNSARAGHTAALLSNGMVLVLGGVGQDHSAPVLDYEIFNP